MDFTFLEMTPFTSVHGKPYPLDMRGEVEILLPSRTSRRGSAFFKNFGVSMMNIGSLIHWIER